MAGFEIRDSIGWVYGSGFPKSLDVSKAIDKGQGQNLQRQLQFVNWMRTTGLKQQQINTIIGKADVGSHYLRLDQPAIATADLFDKLRPYLPEVPEEIERLVAERTGIEWSEYKNRKVVGKTLSGGAKAWANGANNKDKGNNDYTGQQEWDITAPATPEAKQWQGWGTALKPALEPIVVARKPLIGTVAENVLTHGTGGLNIDASRIGSDQNKINTYDKRGPFGDSQEGNEYTSKTVQGRWPANLILDEYTAELLDEQSGTSKSQGGRIGKKETSNIDFGLSGNYSKGDPGFGDTGGASRFFYVAKASKRDRNEGLEELEATRIWDTSRKPENIGSNTPQNRSTQPRQNFHPTVKPTELMRYLVKLITPPGGTVLDPFTGSGSTGKAAILEGFDFIGIELTEDYWPIIEGRLKHAEAKVAEAKEKIEAQPQGLF
jgi:hypothetical protein